MGVFSNADVSNPAVLIIAALCALLNIGGFLVWLGVRWAVNRAFSEIASLQVHRAGAREFRRWTIGVLASAKLITDHNPPPNGD